MLFGTNELINYNGTGEKIKIKGLTGIEPVTYRSAVGCSTTELKARLLISVTSNTYNNPQRYTNTHRPKTYQNRSGKLKN